MTYDEFLTRIIDDGLAAARADYADKLHMLRGAVDGFETCRGKTPKELVALWREAEQAAMATRRASGDLEGDIEGYVRLRCAASEIEWVLNCISVATVNAGGPPLLDHLPTARAAMKYAEVVGVRGADVFATEGN